MWFKNAKCFAFTQAIDVENDTLQSALSEFPFRNCGAQDKTSMGFVPLIEGSELYYHAVGELVVVCLQQQDKVLPAPVINAELHEKMTAYEREHAAPMPKKMQQEEKEHIITQLLPRAFVKNSKTFALLDRTEQLVIVDSASDGKAEVILAMLRKALGSLPVLPLCTRDIQAVLTDWVKNTSPPPFVLLDEIELKSQDEAASVVRAKNIDVREDEILQHIELGKWVEKVAVEFDEKLTCLVQADGGIKRIKYADDLKETNQDIPKDQIAARFDADIALMGAELSALAVSLKKHTNLEAT